MNELTPFAFWCQKVMPAVLDDSLSFYEVLCKLTAKLNDAIETINGHSELITTMQSEIDSLQTLTAQHTQQIADLTRKVQTNADNITAINTRTKGLSTKTDSANNWFGLNLQTDDSYVYRLAWSTDAPAASVLQTSRPGSVYYQIGGPQDDWTWAHVQNSTKGTQPAFTSISRTIYNQITNDINGVESSAAQNAQAIKMLQDLTSDHSTAISSLQDSVAKNTQAITDLNNGLSNTNQTVAKLKSSLKTLDTRTKGISTKTDSSDNWIGISLSSDDSGIYRVAWSNETPAASVLQTSRPGSVYYQIGGPQDDWTWAHVQNSTKGTQPAFTSISRTIYNQITNDINGVESSAAQNAQAIKMLQDLTSDHSTAISSLQDSVAKNTQAITDLNNGLSNTNQTVAKLKSSLKTLDTRTKGISTKTDSSDNWIGISLSSDDSDIYRVAWSNETPALPVLQQSKPGSLYLRVGGPAPDIWLYAWDQNGTDTAMPLVTEKI